MGVENDMYPASLQSASDDDADSLSRMADALKPIAEYSTDASTLDRDVKYLLGGTDTYATTYGGSLRSPCPCRHCQTCCLGHKDRVRQISYQFSFFILPIKLTRPLGLVFFTAVQAVKTAHCWT